MYATTTTPSDTAFFETLQSYFGYTAKTRLLQFIYGRGDSLTGEISETIEALGSWFAPLPSTYGAPDKFPLPHHPETTYTKKTLTMQTPECHMACPRRGGNFKSKEPTPVSFTAERGRLQKDTSIHMLLGNESTHQQYITTIDVSATPQVGEGDTV